MNYIYDSHPTNRHSCIVSAGSLTKILEIQCPNIYNVKLLYRGRLRTKVVEYLSKVSMIIELIAENGGRSRPRREPSVLSESPYVKSV